MKHYIIILIGLWSISISAQDYFIKKPDLNAIDLTGFTIDNYEEGSYLVAGLKYNLDSILYLYVGLLNDEGHITQYDTIPQVDYILSININNDFTLTSDNKYLYNSIGTGRTIIYNYDPLLNNLMALDTIETYDEGFFTYDFISFSENEYTLVGRLNFETGSGLGILNLDNDSISTLGLGNPELRDFAFRAFELTNDEFEVLGSYAYKLYNRTLRVYTFDRELNLLAYITGDTTIARTAFSDAIKDSNGDYIYTCMRYIQNENTDDEFIPMISKLSADGTSYWDTEIGRPYHLPLRSSWYGITESVENDGYVASGSMIINELNIDTIKSFGTLAKLSTEGDSLWYREYSTIDTSYAYTEFSDVVATQDGYMVIGYDECWSGYSGCDRLLSLLIMRTDADGRIVPDTSSVVVTIDDDYDMQLSAYPNPALEYLYIEHELGKEASYHLIDMQGVVHQKVEVGPGLETVKITLSHLPSGPYLIQLLEGNIVKASVKIIKE